MYKADSVLPLIAPRRLVFRKRLCALLRRLRAPSSCFLIISGLPAEFFRAIFFPAVDRACCGIRAKDRARRFGLGAGPLRGRAGGLHGFSASMANVD